MDIWISIIDTSQLIVYYRNSYTYMMAGGRSNTL